MLTAFSLLVTAILWIFLVVAIGKYWAATKKVRNPEPSPVVVPNQYLSTSLMPTLLEEIKFAYLPKSPLENGWAVAYQDENARPTFSAVESEGGTGLRMTVNETKFAMDYPIVTSAKLSRRVTFSILYAATTMVFLEFMVMSADGHTAISKWVKIEIGNRAPNITQDYPDEYTIWLNGEVKNNGWTLLDLATPTVFNQTWGTKGWKLESLTKVRLRGDVSISPISFFW